MTAEDVKGLLPVIEAFANKQPVEFRNVFGLDTWNRIDPDTTEFRFSDLTDRRVMWRVADGD